MNTVIKYAIAAAFIGFIPGSIVILIPLEIAMVYHLSIVHRRPFNLGELGLICTALATVGGGMQAMVGLIFNLAGPLGWVAKGPMAAAFVLCFGWLINWYYATEVQKHKAR
jgi:hypothetical protein